MTIGEDEELALYEAYLSSRDTRLIVPAEDGTPSVQFGFSSEWRECRIWQGYLDASLILLKEILQKLPLHNNLIFPAVFNLRHAIEVALKWHIQYAGGIIPKNTGHNLCILIEAFRSTADDLDDEASYISDCALNCILELALIDPRSVAFRYSTELDGSRIEIFPDRWDVCRLYFAASDLCVWLDDLSVRIDWCQGEAYQP